MEADVALLDIDAASAVPEEVEVQAGAAAAFTEEDEPDTGGEEAEPAAAGLGPKSKRTDRFAKNHLKALRGLGSGMSKHKAPKVHQTDEENLKDANRLRYLQMAMGATEFRKKCNSQKHSPHAGFKCSYCVVEAELLQGWDNTTKEKEEWIVKWRPHHQAALIGTRYGAELWREWVGKWSRMRKKSKVG